MTAARRVAGKLGALLLTLFLASLLVFFSRFLVPGDPVSFLLRGRKPTPEAVAQVTAQYGLDLPPWQQYLQWLGGVLQGDFGRSLQYRQDVTTVIGERLPVTLGLVVMAGADDRGRRARRAASSPRSTAAACSTGRCSSASPCSARSRRSSASIVLIAVFAVQLGWFPSFGSGEGFLDTVYHLVLPSIALAVVFVVLVGKVTRSSMVDQLGREHVEVATSRGLKRAHRGAPPRLPQRDRADPHGQRPPRRRASSSRARSSRRPSASPASARCSCSRSTGSTSPSCRRSCCFVVFAFVVVNAIIDILEPWIDPRSAAGAGAR